MRIIIVRHGEPDYQKDCLTGTGRIQAARAAQRLRGEGIEEIWSSTMGRAYETAEATADLLGLPIRKLECMRELYWGSIDRPELYQDGHPWDTVDQMARSGVDLTDKDWRKGPYFCNNRVVESVGIVEKGIDEWLASLGYERNGSYYRHLKAEDKHRSIALFCHGGSSSAMIGHILNLPFPYVCAMLHVEFTGITILRFERREGACTLPCLELANDWKHILEEG
jgi:probable phosphoglycerate mutase